MVTPICLCSHLSCGPVRAQVDHLSNLGVEVAHRLGYDDFNESLCNKEIVRSTLRELRITARQLATADTNETYQNLTNLGFQKGSVANFDPQVSAMQDLLVPCILYLNGIVGPGLRLRAGDGFIRSASPSAPLILSAVSF